MRVADHFRTHGQVHAIWAITVLVAIIAWLLLGERDGNVINAYVSFASSIASLILAVVAIFYSVVSTQSQSEMIGSLKGSSDSLESAARNIDDTSAALNKRFEEVVGQVAMMPAAVEALSAKFDQRAAAATSTNLTGQEDTGDRTVKILGTLKWGGQVSLYLLAKAFSFDMPFNTAKVFKNRENDTVWQSILTGFVLAVHGFKPSGIKLEQIVVDSEVLYKVTSFGDIDAKKIVELTESENNTKRLDPLLLEIQTYFKQSQPTLVG